MSYLAPNLKSCDKELQKALWDIFSTSEPILDTDIKLCGKSTTDKGMYYINDNTGLEEYCKEFKQ